MSSHKKDRIGQIPAIVGRLCKAVRELEVLFPDRPFTLDGHLVGSIGEVIAAHTYGLTLLPPSTECHDAKSKDGRLVQIKATQGRMIGLRHKPDFLVVLKLLKNGTTEEIYNGPGKPAWDCGREDAEDGAAVYRAGEVEENGGRGAKAIPPEATFTVVRRRDL